MTDDNLSTLLIWAIAMLGVFAFLWATELVIDWLGRRRRRDPHPTRVTPPSAVSTSLPLATREEERQRVASAGACAERDEKDMRREARYLARASRETVRPGGNTASKAYLARFKK